MWQIHPVPLLRDNYAWILTTAGCDAAVVVDPGEAAPVEKALARRGLRLSGVLLTHHHGDHTAGAEELAGGRVPVYAPADEDVPGATERLSEGNRLELPAIRLQLRVLAVPGHTRGHLTFLGPGFVLAGDTLFAGGCGRAFEGPPEQLFSSLERLAALPVDTLLYCGHEYTLANLEFAVEVEPGNAALQVRLAAVRELRRDDRATVPSSIGVELRTNPFLRCREDEVMATAARLAGAPVRPGAETFTVIRRHKDGW